MARICDTVLLVEPVNFGFNQQTEASNSFQQKEHGFSAEEIQQKALQEFRAFVQLLRDHGITVLDFQAHSDQTPDSIFPNNWFCTDQHGVLLTFPMAAENRRAERDLKIISFLEQEYKYRVDRLLEDYEKSGRYLEGTGSLIIDHEKNVAFAALSPRTNFDVLEIYSQKSGNEIVAFQALGPAGELIYHTNVMLCIADSFVLIGLDTIAPNDRERVKNKLESLGKELILLSNEQIYRHFTGNALQLQNKQGEKFLVMSQKAKSSLTQIQLEQIARHNNLILAPDLETIETIGGGSARCMLAEIF
ncbi:MAG: amidinotransferase [Crocinitomicaceae bacterium]|jgi:hypothetical protein|nr:amidinotransferase [Crocinitomicaceae bacterium]